MDLNDNNSHDTGTDRQLQFMQHLVEENVRIAGDAVEIGTGTWAIHGVIPVDGSVIVAEFDTYDEARTALDTIAIASPVPATR